MKNNILKNVSGGPAGTLKPISYPPFSRGLKTLIIQIILLSGLVGGLSASGFAQVVTGKIPLKAAYWYQLNSRGNGLAPGDGLAQLTDGILDKSVFMGWNKLIANYEVKYEFKDLSEVYISSIRMYDGTGMFVNQPFRLYAQDTLTGTPVLLATFTGERYRAWVEITLPRPIRARYLLLNVWSGFPDELELYGSYQVAPPRVLPPGKDVRLGDMLGVNSFVWDFTQDPKEPGRSDRIFEPKMALLQAFTQYRDYIDWKILEATPGSYAFNPTRAGWDYDVLYKRLAQEGKLAVACIKNTPDWFLQASYPPNTGDQNNVPAPYQSDWQAPASYVQYARLGFQVAARYGHNTGVDPALLSGVVTGPIYPNAPQVGSRSLAIGLGYLSYLECENEPDMWWNGRRAYQTAYEYAAQLSAYYDGHQRTLGAGVGVKNADPTMQVVMGGTAGTSTEYVRGIIDWCKKYRGFHPDGSVDLCFDVINYHCYANQLTPSQSTASTRGSAPELADTKLIAQAFVALGREYQVEVWMTEAGYDVNPGSPMHAPAIGSKTALLVQADWILRTALTYARQGVNRLFLYQTYDLNLSNTQQFASCGLLDGPTLTRKPAADFLYQSNRLLGKYTYKETLSQDPLVDRYEYQGRSAYVLMIPDETGRTAPYRLDLRDAVSANVYSPTPGQDSMRVQPALLSNGLLDLTVSETPIFVLPAPTTASRLVPKLTPTGQPASDPTDGPASFAPTIAAPKSMSLTLVAVPNPFTDQVTLQFSLSDSAVAALSVYDIQGQRVSQLFSGLVPGGILQVFPLDISCFAAGIYVVHLDSKAGSLTRRIVLVR